MKGSLLVGCVLLFSAYQENQFRSIAYQEPSYLSCRQLFSDGYGDNANVVLNDCYLSAESMVYEYQYIKSNWTRVWVAAKPDYSGQVRLVVTTNSVGNDAELQAFVRQTSFSGLITSEFYSLDLDVQTLLNESFPQVDFNEVYILQEGRAVSGSSHVVELLCGGILLLLVGLYLAYDTYIAGN